MDTVCVWKKYQCYLHWYEFAVFVYCFIASNLFLYPLPYSIPSKNLEFRVRYGRIRYLWFVNKGVRKGYIFA